MFVDNNTVTVHQKLDHARAEHPGFAESDGLTGSTQVDSRFWLLLSTRTPSNGESHVKMLRLWPIMMSSVECAVGLARATVRQAEPGGGVGLHHLMSCARWRAATIHAYTTVYSQICTRRI